MRARPLALAVLAALTATGLCAAPAPAASAKSKTVWLCRPGLAKNPCLASLTATVNDGSGKTTVERAKPAKHPKIDCFYVYPTVSGQSRPIATLHIDPEEREVASQQVSRFSQDCRIFAPMYRQLTVAALAGQQPPTDAQRETAMQVLCTNPAALANANGQTAPLRPYAHVKAFPGPRGPFVTPIPSAPTPWVAQPKLYTATCLYDSGSSWLQISDVGTLSDGRLRVSQALGPLWGLHLFDVNIAVGNLVDLVARQTAAYLK